VLVYVSVVYKLVYDALPQLFLIVPIVFGGVVQGPELKVVCPKHKVQFLFEDVGALAEVYRGGP